MRERLRLPPSEVSALAPVPPSPDQERLDQAFAELPAIEAQALAFHQKDPQQAIAFLNAYTNGFARSVVDRMGEVGDEIWLKYVSGF